MKWEEGSSLTAKERHVGAMWGTEGAENKPSSISMLWVEIIAFILYSGHVLGLSFHFYSLCVFV